MNKRINKKIDGWWDSTTGMNLKKKIPRTPRHDCPKQVLIYIYEQNHPLLLKESDYQKRQRAKNVVPTL